MVDSAQATAAQPTFNITFNNGSSSQGVEGDALEALFAAFGVNGSEAEITGASAQVVGDILKGWTERAGLPEGIRGDANALIDSSVAELQGGGSTVDTQSEVWNVVMNMIWNMIQDAADEAEENTSTGQGQGNNGNGNGLNWLAAIAKALGEVAGRHLGEAIELADKIGKIGELEGSELEALVGGGFEASGGDDPKPDQARAMTVLQARMQAETQLFKMVFEAASTLIKTTGEGFSTMARKQ